MAEMTRDEVYEWLRAGAGYVRMATNGPDGYPHVVPLGYFLQGDDIVLNMRGQREANVRRDPRVCLSWDTGTGMADLKGVVIRGSARMVDDPAGCLELTREAARGRGVPESELPTEARPGRNFAVVTVERVASWDNAKR
ncbi:MAG: pyridoxamine 5'-phosphate oxidase family protein [Dehalococcoidia bacterium]|nr:pyridoxamine 5'-phosphate oxidase family protein [Dehalococcoidia bacterium]